MSNTLRPLGLGEIIDTASKIYVRHWRVLMLVVAVVIVPAGVASYLVLSAVQVPDLAPYLDDPNLTADGRLLDEIIPLFRATAVAALIQLVGAMLAAAGSMRAVAEIYLGSEPDWRASLAIAGRRLPALLITGVLIIGAIGALTAGFWLLAGLAAAGSGRGAFVALALLLSLIVAPWLAVSWAPAISVLVVEGPTPAGALKRSFNLVKGRWWPTFGTILTAWLIVVILSSIASRILGAFLPSGENVVAGLIISTAISVVTSPFVVAVLAVLYFDLRARHERFDLSRLADEIGIAVPSSESDWAPPVNPPDQSEWPPLPPDADGIEQPPAE